MAQSGEEEIIIIGGGKGGKRSAGEVSVKPQGVHKVSTVLKQYSTWILAALIALPEAFQVAVAHGIISVSGGDDPVSRIAQGVAAIGLLLKFVKQQKPAE